MSEQKKDEKPPAEEKNALIEANVALVLAENKALKDEVVKKDALVADLTKRLSQATDLIENDSKARLISEIAPKTTTPKEILSKMSVEELKTTKSVLDRAVAPAFKSGTPIVDDKKPSLDGIFDSYMSRIKNKGGK